MTNTKKLIGAAAFSVALAGGGIAGALLGTPGTSGAQETTTSTAAAADDEARPHGGPRREHLEAAATALGMTVDELRTALVAGQTIAEIATVQGVDVDTVIDAMVADASDELRERITAFVNGEAPLGGPGGGHHGGPGSGARLDAVATALGMTEDELKAALQEGQSIAEIATAEGVDLQTVIDALVADAEAHLDEAVADGRLTQAEADEKKAELETRITEMVNAEGGFRGGPGGGYGPRP